MPSSEPVSARGDLDMPGIRTHDIAGVLSNNKRSHDTTLEEFDHINSINYRGCWLSSRAAITQMLTQEPLPSHDGRPGTRGSIVNIASQLGIVGRPAARKLFLQEAPAVSEDRSDPR